MTEPPAARPAAARTLTPSPGSPAALGYFMPPEWAPHAATWLAWPHNRESWPGKFEPIPQVWARLAAVLAECEDVHILASGAALAESERLVGHLPRVVLHDVPTNDAWMRDHGPTFLAGPPGAEPALVDWRYNAWGGKYPPFEADDAVPRRIAETTGRRRFAVDAVMEGGAIDVDGAGTLLTTEQCLLNPNRNSALGREQVEQLLCDHLNVQKVLWLGEGIEGDDTDGHIDELARFVAPGRVLAAVEEDAGDVNHAALAANLQRLFAATDARGRPLEVIPLPTPRPLHHDGQRLPASYCNFYVANEIVVVPQFNDPADRSARAILAEHFPTRTIVGLPAADLAWGLGAFHCITQQEGRSDPAD